MVRLTLPVCSFWLLCSCTVMVQEACSPLAVVAVSTAWPACWAVTVTSVPLALLGTLIAPLLALQVMSPTSAPLGVTVRRTFWVWPAVRVRLVWAKTMPGFSVELPETVTAQAALILPSEEATVILAVPVLTPVSCTLLPLPSMRTMLSSLLFQVKLACASAGSRVALSVWVLPCCRFSEVELKVMPVSSAPLPVTLMVMLST